MIITFENGLWESDFILNEFFPGAEVTSNFDVKTDALAFCSRTHSYDEILTIVHKTKPKIIICLSDEFYDEDLSCFNELGNHCDLFMRQYHHSNYTYTSNTIHIPLGYTNGCKVFQEKKELNWSFLGDIKTDRQEMVNQFRKIPKHFVGKSASKDLMCKIYSKSIFVPCGRGNSSLDCFRLYEASMNGAIPVVVGTEKEIECTFKYEENPPWIFAETWKDAYNRCLNNSRKSIEVVSWWNKRLNTIRSKVSEVL